MDDWRKYRVVALIVCLLHLTLVGVGPSADESPLPNPGLTKQQVGQFGVGAKVKAELAGGKKLKGSIQSVEEGGFLLASNQAGSSTGVAYEQVSQLKLPQVTCNSKGQPDAAEVKRLAAGLAVGHHIRVKTAEGKEYHGYIVALDAENFTMLPDDTTASVQLAYTDVVQLGPNLSKHTKTAVIVTVVVLAALLIFAAVRGPAS